ncbi:MAG: uroporphyrinogen-III synthase [Alloprevotella sp.]|nr:uroporphyrinogen-III synthase [Alloprevotella sp.]
MLKKILVSQPEPTNPKSPYFAIAEKFGVTLDFHPFIRVEGLTASEFRKQRVTILDYSAIVFTSRHAIDHFFTLCRELRVQVPETMKYFAISETVSLYIQKYVQYRKRKVFFGTTGKMPDLLAVMCKHKQEKYLVPQSDVHSDEVSTLLTQKKIKFRECIMYRTVSNEMPKSLRNYSMIILFTPSGVESLLKNYPDFKQGRLRIGCWGSATAQALQAAGMRIDLSAPTADNPSMTGSLEAFLQKEMEEEQKKEAAKKKVASKKTSTTAKKPVAKKATAAKKTTTAAKKPAAKKKVAATAKTA